MSAIDTPTVRRTSTSLIAAQRPTVWLTAISIIAMGGILAAPSAPNQSLAISDSAISAAIDALVPTCRIIAIRRLRHQLDAGDKPYLTSADVLQTIEPLESGGAPLCDTITSQSFVLGGS